MRLKVLFDCHLAILKCLISGSSYCSVALIPLSHSVLQRLPQEHLWTAFPQAEGHVGAEQSAMLDQGISNGKWIQFCWIGREIGGRDLRHQGLQMRFLRLCVNVTAILLALVFLCR